MGVTIYDIAERARVSIATVSRVLNGQPRVSERTRQHVLDIATQLGYQPHASAQSLARQRSHLVAAVLPMLTSYFFMEVMRGIHDRLQGSDFDLLVLPSHTLEDVEGQLERALQKGLAAGVLLLSTPLSADWIERLKQSEKPVVLVDAFRPEFDSVSVDSERGGYVATRHLLDLGYRRIGLILGNPESVPSIQRRAGYLRALGEARLPQRDACIVASRDGHNHGYTEQAGYEAMCAILSLTHRPEAVFAASDIQAVGALRAIQEAGLSVPDDVALVGFDDIQLSSYIGLSTLHQPIYEM
ncbi:MAG TPA: LacI family DNA-binding transcriptional regulator, partial [Rhodothermales bacterium]|nr:LacI family DNA-binding transcriptional regulator [Rhodothermales bacterium]